MANLYAVYISGGTTHSQFARLHRQLSDLNARTLDYTGHWGIVALKHHMDAETVHGMITYKIRSKKSIRVEEVTRDTIKDRHNILIDTYENYFSKYDKFPNID